MPERKDSKELQASEARLRQVIDLVPHFIFAKDQKGRFTLSNRALAEAYGTTVEELIGKTDFDFATSAEEAKRFRADDAEVQATGRIKEVLERLTDSEGEVKFLQTTKIPFTCAEEPSVLGVAVDITKLKKAEEDRRHLEAQIQHAQKLESLGVLAGGLAHDFNNILTGILANAGILRNRLSSSPADLQPLEAIEKAAERLAELADQVLAYSGKGRSVVEDFDLDPLVHEMVQLLRSSISKKAKLIERPAGKLPFFHGNASQIRQVVMNLITNASDSLEDNPGEILLTTGVVDTDDPNPDVSPLPAKMSSGRYIYLSVADSGCGMDEKTRQCLFDPFFTTKSEGRGLGMAAVLRILEEHRGFLQVVSTPGEGTTFTVLLPANAEDQPLPETAAPSSVKTSDHGTILVVDDERLVRDVARIVLQETGYHVLEAEDGQEALEAFQQHSIDLVLLDIAMPKVDGAETFRELRHVQPQTRVLFSSGYGNQALQSLLSENQGVDFIKKPYRVQELVAKIQSLLSAAS